MFLVSRSKRLFHRSMAATLLLIHPLMMLPSDVVAQTASQDTASRFTDLPDTFKERDQTGYYAPLHPAPLHPAARLHLPK